MKKLLLIIPLIILIGFVGVLTSYPTSGGVMGGSEIMDSLNNATRTATQPITFDSTVTFNDSTFFRDAVVCSNTVIAQKLFLYSDLMSGYYTWLDGDSMFNYGNYNWDLYGAICTLKVYNSNTLGDSKAHLWVENDIYAGSNCRIGGYISQALDQAHYFDGYGNMEIIGKNTGAGADYLVFMLDGTTEYEFYAGAFQSGDVVAGNDTNKTCGTDSIRWHKFFGRHYITTDPSKADTGHIHMEADSLKIETENPVAIGNNMAIYGDLTVNTGLMIGSSGVTVGKWFIRSDSLFLTVGTDSFPIPKKP